MQLSTMASQTMAMRAASSWFFDWHAHYGDLHEREMRLVLLMMLQPSVVVNAVCSQLHDSISLGSFVSVIERAG